MAKTRYQPPEQGALGMTFDAFVMLVLVFVSLSAPIWITTMNAPAEEASAVEDTAPAPTWEELGQNATMAAQWEKLGKDPTAAAAIINNKFDYTIDPIKLGLTALLLVVYYFFMLRFSEREYREVIAEKFD
jgi:predicted PurR-regulated permease PerM